MNLDLVREDIAKYLNKNYEYEGILSAVYPYVFTVFIDGSEKSFNYADVIIGDVVIKPI